MKRISELALRLGDPVLRRLLQDVASGKSTPSAALRSALDYVDQARPRQADDAAATRGISLADAALGAEGLAVIDARVRELGRRVAEGRMTGNEAVSFIEALIESDHAQAPARSEVDIFEARVGPFYEPSALLDWLRVSADQLEALVEKGDVLRVTSADGFPLFPAFQFGPDPEPLPRLREVLAELDPGKVDEWGDAIWMNAPADELAGLSPAAALRVGQTDAVIRLARAAGSFLLG